MTHLFQNIFHVFVVFVLLVVNGKNREYGRFRNLFIWLFFFFLFFSLDFPFCYHFFLFVILLRRNFKANHRWSLQKDGTVGGIHWLHLCRGVRLPKGESFMWQKTIRSIGFSNSGALGNAECPFIAIAPRSSLARSGSTWEGFIYGSNSTKLCTCDKLNCLK